MQKKLSGVVKTSIYVSRRSVSLLEKLKNAQLFSFFVLTARRQFAKTFWQTCQKCTCFVHINIFRENSFLEICFFSGILAVNFLPYSIQFQCGCQKIFWSVCKFFFEKKKKFFEIFIVFFFSFLHIERIFLSNFVDKKARVVKTDF